jgi:hypothetical protein
LSTLLYIFIVGKSAYIHTAGYFFDCLWLVGRQSLREPDELFTGNIPGPPVHCTARRISRLQDAYTAAESRHLPIKAPSYDPAAEQKRAACEQVKLKLLLYKCCQPVNGLPHIRMSADDVDIVSS